MVEKKRGILMIEPNVVHIALSTKCNLKCDYCYIHKNKAIFDYDKVVRKALKENILLESLKKIYGENRHHLTQLYITGGELLLNLSLLNDKLDTYLDEFPNLYHFTLLTNLTTNITELGRFVDIMKNYRYKDMNREFHVHIQVSLDGPSEVTDRHRLFISNQKSGVTETVVNNLKPLVYLLDSSVPGNVGVSIIAKSTLCMDTITNVLVDEESVIKYYKFFEDLHVGLNNIPTSNNLDIQMMSIPNFVAPGEYTQEDGKKLAEFVKMVLDISDRNRDQLFLPLYDTMLWLDQEFPTIYDQMENPNTTIDNVGYSCCSGGYSTIGLHPDGKTYGVCSKTTGMLSTKFYEDSLVNSKIEGTIFDRKVVPKQRNSKYMFERNSNLLSLNINDTSPENVAKVKNMEAYATRAGALITFSAISALVYELAQAGQISPMFKNSKKMRNRAVIFLKRINECIIHNLQITNHFLVPDTSMAKLLLNGTFELLYERHLRDSKKEMFA